MDKLAIKLKAAKLCGHDPIESVWQIDVIFIGKGQDERAFDIFTNPADQIATVIALGEKHDIGLSYIFKSKSSPIPQGWAWMEDNADSGKYECGFKTYTEAVAKACEAVSINT